LPTPRIAAFSPGLSPPAVRMPIVLAMSLDPDRGLQLRRHDATRDPNILLRSIVQATTRAPALTRSGGSGRACSCGLLPLRHPRRASNARRSEPGQAVAAIVPSALICAPAFTGPMR
jgi:hypothetical protein